MASIEMGNWDDEDDVGEIVDARRHLPDHPDAAIERLERCANAGSVKATLILADLYMRGKYVARDLRKAEHWFLRVGQKGIPFGYHMAADMRVRQSNDVAARELFKESANQGFLPSLYRVGYMTAQGCGGEKDLERARQFLQCAIRRGHWGARIYYATILTRGYYGAIRIPIGIFLFLMGWSLLALAVLRSGGRLVREWDDTYLL